MDFVDLVDRTAVVDLDLDLVADSGCMGLAGLAAAGLVAAAPDLGAANSRRRCRPKQVVRTKQRHDELERTGR